MAQGDDLISRAVQLAELNGRTKYDSELTEEMLSRIKYENDIMIEFEAYVNPSIKEYLNTHGECLNYQFYNLDNSFNSLWKAVAFSPELDSTFIEQLNFQIANRYSFIEETQLKLINNMSEQCARHIRPLTVPSMLYTQMHISVVSGAFWLLAGMFIISIVAFFMEIIAGYQHKAKANLSTTMEHHIVERELNQYYLKITHLINNQFMLDEGKTWLIKVISDLEQAKEA